MQRLRVPDLDDFLAFGSREIVLLSISSRTPGYCYRNLFRNYLLECNTDFTTRNRHINQPTKSRLGGKQQAVLITKTGRAGRNVYKYIDISIQYK